MLFEWNPLKVDRNSFRNSFRVSDKFFVYNIVFFSFFLLVFSISSIIPKIYLSYGFYFGILVLGMAHGAADHLFIWGFINSINLFKKILILISYALLSIIYYYFWIYIPLFALLFFLAITIVHWGQGDRYFCQKHFNCCYLNHNAVLRLLNILLKGSIPILIPIYLN